jgi:hypothetical protein
VEEELPQPVGEQGKDSQECARLDDDNKEIALMSMQPTLSNQQMAGGGDWKKFGDPLNDTQDDNDEPKWHARLETTKSA